MHLYKGSEQMNVERLEASEEGIPERYRLSAGAVVGDVVPSAGFGLVSWKVDGEELLAMPLPLDEYMKESHLGGIPLLYPWANRLRGERYSAGGKDVDLSLVNDLKRDNNGLPMHGLLLRFSHWHVAVLDNGITGTIEWADHPELMQAFPFAHQLCVSWTVSEYGLRASLKVTAGANDVPLVGGWHPYFAPPALNQRDLMLSGPPMKSVPLDGQCLPTGQVGELIDESGALGVRTFDNLYTAPADGFSYAIAGDSLKVRLDANEKWQAMQLYATQTGGFVCVEPMLAETAALCDGTAPMLAAGETFEACFDVSVGANS